MSPGFRLCALAEPEWINQLTSFENQLAAKSMVLVRQQTRHDCWKTAMVASEDVSIVAIASVLSELESLFN